MADVWYLDLYCYKALGGKEFPVNSYYSNDLKKLCIRGSLLLRDSASGIDEIRVSNTTKGQRPVSIDAKDD